ncbi:hypothetical protein BD311DRAFT_270457 [Dichomitus squalens]|uniref:F-box domain-containing protein n=1 Tax=Dichomitus squalens TaxID=114155 RepID=A0A4Q9MP08_9APHY|nr:hypothetical protein BD311DRAFT_270457 [Dichomitus squalens]
MNDLSAALSPHQLRIAVISLTSLETLIITSVSPEYNETLLNTLPSLWTADLSYGLRWIGERGPLGDPFFLLHSHRHTLETLSLRSVHLPDHDVSFVALRRLELQSVRLPQGVGSLIHLFPNIQQLTLLDIQYTNPNVHYWRHPDRISINDARELRTTSKLWQVTHGSWEKLMKIKVETALSLYSLGLVCSVDTVEILDPGSFAYEESDRELDGVMPAVLADVRPRCLVVDIPSAESMTTLLAPLYGSPSVTRLTISFSLGMLMGIPLAYILVSATAHLPAFARRCVHDDLSRSD